MKSLSLYVDKWFITVAANVDGSVIPLTLPNGEDRIWLYFHEDVANNRIVYGKAFETNYRDKEPHYFGDIFPLIESSRHHFTRYDNRPEEMREIFKVSNIFTHLHEAVQDEGTVDTYISFSADISDVARLKFIEELQESKFNVLESVARISHLALEESKKHGAFTEEGIYLGLIATNDNLHFSLYKSEEDLFVRVGESSLPGFGLDIRNRALIESVVENVNRTARFLTTQDEYAKEYKRQERFAYEWLRQIDEKRPGFPVTLSHITFAVAPNNPYPVTIIPSELNQRTEGLVDDIVRKVAEFVQAKGVQAHEVKGIVFIGNTFSNTTFTDAIKTRFVLADDKLVKYRENELPKVVNVYSQIDCTQFRVATEGFVKNAKLQEELNRQALEEEKRRTLAQEKVDEENARKKEEQEVEKKYREAIEHVEEYEIEHDYEQMIEWAKIALDHRPGDEYATEKLNAAQNRLTEHRLLDKQFETMLHRIRTAYSEGRWSDVINLSDIALEARPDSEEVLEMKRESQRQLKIKEKVTEFLNRADMFFAQKLYKAALDEVAKVLSLAPSNAEAKNIERKISEVKAQQAKKVSELVQKLKDAEANHNYPTAINVCEELIGIDIDKTRKWTEKVESLKSQQREFEEQKRYLESLLSDIEKYRKLAKWSEVVRTCDEYLARESDEYIQAVKAEALHYLEEQKIQAVLQKTAELISQRSFEGARKLLASALASIPDSQLLKDKQKEVERHLKLHKGQVTKMADRLEDDVREHNFIEAIARCKELIEYDEENKSDWQLRLQEIQGLQIEKNELERNFRRKKADLMVLIRRGDSSVEKKIKDLQAEYHTLGITKFDSVFSELLTSLHPDGDKKVKIQAEPKESGKINSPKKKKTPHKPQQKALEEKIVLPQTEGFALLRQGKFREAKRVFATTERNTEMSGVCTQLIRLRRAQNNGSITPGEQGELTELYKRYNILNQ